MFKKYRVRPYSPIWWVINVGRVVLGSVFFLALFLGLLWVVG